MGYYDENPGALRDAVRRADMAAYLFGDTNVLQTVWSMADPETEGGRRLKPELEAVVERAARMMPEGVVF